VGESERDLPHMSEPDQTKTVETGKEIVGW
jgi:hypothetical protein